MAKEVKKPNPACRAARGGVLPLKSRRETQAAAAKPLSATKLATIVAIAVKQALKK